MSMIRATSVGVIWLAGAALAACGGGGAPSAGKERAACYGNNTCDQGLLCLSDRCVRPPPADCDKVGAKLASYRLGNYAPREQRDQVVAELAGVCRAAQLSVEEGACILDARSRVDVARCPRPLLDELAADQSGCRAAAQSLAGVLVAELIPDAAARQRSQGLIDELIDATQQTCVDDAWSVEAMRCIGAAQRTQDLKPCEKTLSKAQQDSAERNLEPLMERLQQAIRN